MLHHRVAGWLQRALRAWERWTTPVFPETSVTIRDGVLSVIRSEGSQPTVPVGDVIEIILIGRDMITYDAVFIQFHFVHHDPVGINELDIPLIDTISHLAEHFTISDGWQRAITQLRPGEHHILFPPEPHSVKEY